MGFATQPNLAEHQPGYLTCLIKLQERLMHTTNWIVSFNSIKNTSERNKQMSSTAHFYNSFHSTALQVSLHHGQTSQRWRYKPASTALTGVFLKLQPQTWMTSLTPWHRISVFVKTCVCRPRLSAHTATTSPGSHPNSGSCVRPRRRPTEVGTRPCISRPETHWQNEGRD